MRFLDSKFTQNAFAAGTPPRTPLEELKRSPRSAPPDPLPISGRTERGKGYWGRERGREGKGRGEGGKEEGGGKGRGGEFVSLALGG